MRAIVITTDFSDGSKQVARFGFELAKQLRTDVTLCNAMIIPAEIPQAGIVAWPVDVYDDLMEDSTKELSHLKETLLSGNQPKDAFKPTITCFIESGTVCDVVNHAVDLQSPGLTVVGSHQHEGLGQWMIGNHVRGVIDTSKIPLLLVPAGTHFKKVKKIAFATDFSDMRQDLNCIRKLVTIAERLNAGILLIHVNNEDQNTPQHYLTQILKELTEKASYPKIDYQLIKDSRVVAGLDWLIEHGDIEMLAMVHHTHGFFTGLLKGSHTQKMAGHIQIPLLIFPDTLFV
ncbi:universal stress protein [Mucilaginibacter sp. NFX135]|uniref:universal stress protein n=1 Tax=Mucilaginibacter sp. NFX135 TaxID=3402687 RepID=UPI003AFAEF63